MFVRRILKSDIKKKTEMCITKSKIKIKTSKSMLLQYFHKYANAKRMVKFAGMVQLTTFYDQTQQVLQVRQLDRLQFYMWLT